MLNRAESIANRDDFVFRSCGNLSFMGTDCYGFHVAHRQKGSAFLAHSMKRKHFLSSESFP